MLDIEEFVKTDRYIKTKKKFLLDLDTALQNIKSDDSKIRKLGEKRLSSNARRELGWNCLPIREWFLDKKNQIEIYNAIQIETDDKLIAGYLLTLSFFYERYIIHPMWEEIFIKEVQLEYQEWLKTIIKIHIHNKSTLVKKEVATLLAIVGDNRAWDIFNELLLKKNSLSGWVYSTLSVYAINSIVEEQINILIKTFDIIIKKTTNATVKRDAIGAKEKCSKLKTDYNTM